jgi:signal transduction histidine kinase
MTLRVKIVAAYTAVFGVLLISFAILIYGSSEDAAIVRIDAYLNAHASKLGTEVEEQHDEGTFPDIPDFRALVPEGLTSPHFRLVSLAGETVIGDSLLSVLPAPVLDHEHAEGSRTETVELGMESWRVLTAPVEVNDTIAYALQIADALSGVEAYLAGLRTLYGAAIPLGLLAASLAALGITRVAFRPVRAMIETARNISGTNLDQRLRLPAVRDEIRLLAETFNEMLERISSAFQSQRQFLADASHEIRTPLTVIRSELEYLQQRTSGRSAGRALALSLKQVERLETMTEGMLLLTRLENIHGAPPLGLIRVDELVIDSVRTVTSLFRKKRVRLVLRIEEAVEVQGNAEMLKRAVLNLLDNACKYTQRGGRVFVRLWMEGGASLPVCIAVEDNGRGIPARELPLVFTRFYRAETARAAESGSGLGLAIAKSLVAFHGGTLTLQSQEHKSTVCTIRLPAVSS